MAHNAISDVSAIYKVFLLMKQLPLFMNYFAHCTRSLQSAVDILDYQLATSYNLKTFGHLVANYIFLNQKWQRKLLHGDLDYAI